MRKKENACGCCNNYAHYFCKICGINTHHRRRSDPNQYGYNIGCIEGFEMPWIDNAPFVDNTAMSLIDSKNKLFHSDYYFQY